MVTVLPSAPRRTSFRTTGRTALFAQFAVFALILGTIVASPPERGPMLLIPLRSDAALVVHLALALEGRIMGAGPLPGSVVVRGERAAMIAAMLPHGILVTAATARFCGPRAAGADGAA